jgi:hypothetical protein
MIKDRQAQDAIEQREPATKDKTDKTPKGRTPARGLTDPEKTPGTGSLPDDAAKEADVGPD